MLPKTIHAARDANGELALWDGSGNNLLNSFSNLPVEQRQTIAAEIVRRWNVYEGMREALQAIADADAAKDSYPGDGWRLAHEKICGYARAALAAYDSRPTVKVGDSVKLTRNYGDYPLTPIPAGSAGIVVAIDSNHIHVRMNDVFPDLEAWDNVLQVSTQHGGTWTPDYSALAAYLPADQRQDMRGQNIDTQA